tara:strand:- start:1303 stop:1587 length:285 start_codon:yes stop_codon:yes gene_type:complete
MSEKNANVIMLDSHNDTFGSTEEEIFHPHSEDWNVVELKVDKPRRLEMTQGRYYTEIKLFISDNIEQLEKLAEWSKVLQKGVKKHIKNLKKVED